MRRFVYFFLGKTVAVFSTPFACTLFPIILLLFVCSSCSNSSETSEGTLTTPKQDSILPPATTLITHPATPLPGTYPPPQKIKSTIPPTTKPAGFFSIMQNYTTDNGLTIDAIRCGLMDMRGRLWFGTNGGGVSCYDGKSFTTYTTAQGLANNTVWSIAEDKRGNLWFGTYGGGASCYDGKSFTTYTTTQGLANNVVHSITEDKSGNLWFGTYGGGVSCYDGKGFATYTTTQGLANNTVWSITEDKRGNLWFGTNGGGVSCYDGKSFTTYTTAQGLANNRVFSITEDKSGNLWFGTHGGGVSCYDGKNFATYTTAQGLANNVVFSITEDKSGNLWFGTYGGGVSRYDGKDFITYATTQGLANNVVFSITKDKSGNLWFGTYGGGISCYNGMGFTTYTSAQGLADNIVFSITEDKSGNLWFTTSGGGVSRYDGKSFTTYTTAQGLTDDPIVSIAEDKSGNLWFGTGASGVSCYDGNTFTSYTTAQGLAHNTVVCITEDKNGNLWFGTGGGVSCYDGKSFTTYTTTQGLADNTVWSITEDKWGNIWFGTNDGGVSCYDGKSFATYATAQGLVNNLVYNITEDKEGNLWFGTGGGVSRYDGQSFLNYTNREGLPDNFVTQLVISSNGEREEKSGEHLVIGTNQGLSILTGWKDSNGKFISFDAGLEEPNTRLKNCTPVFEIYNSAKGYPVKDVNATQNAMYEDSKGILWIATGSDKTGLVRFDYAALNKNNKPSDIVIQGVKINNSTIAWHTLFGKYPDSVGERDSLTSPANINEEIITFGRTLSDAERDTMYRQFGEIQFEDVAPFYPVPEQLVLSSRHNTITFDYAAIELAQPYLIRYQYMLEGYDTDWNPVTDKTTATFGNMYEGRYTFKLKAQSPFGVWSEPVSYQFRVLPPWWRTWWMYSVYVIVLVSLVVFIVWLNGRRLRARAAELTKEVEKATVTIVEQKKIVEEKNKDITDSINYAKRIQQAMLPHFMQLSAAFPQSFVLFKPKDIVSGDFYFFSSTTPTGNTGHSAAFIAVADCTGHGVPGAFMSVIGMSKLNDAVSQSSETSAILSLLNKGIKTALRQSDSDESTRDGMDIALCSIEYLSVSEKDKGVKLNYAGANRPLWIIRKGQQEIEETKATKRPIGGLTADNAQFENHELQLQAGDTFYIFTDGYADQFGGREGKKLMTKRFKDTLLSIQNKTMKEQEEHLDNFVEDWKAGREQVDDILVIGIRI